MNMAKKQGGRVFSILIALSLLMSLLSMGMSASAWNTGEGIDVYWNSTSTVSGNVSYDAMDTAVQSQNTLTYSARNDYGTFKTYSGKMYAIKTLMETIGKTDQWANAPDTTKVTVQAADGYTVSILKSQLMAQRNIYSSNGIITETGVESGFLRYTKNGNTYFKFVFGQQAFSERTASRFTDCTGTGNCKVFIDTAYVPSQSGSVNAFVNSDTTTPYASGSTIGICVGDSINFNKDDTAYLNSTMIYYNYGSNLNTVPTPSCSDSSTLYNTQTPSWGGIYVPITFNTAGTYYIKAVGTSFGSTDSNISTFTVVVS